MQYKPFAPRDDLALMMISPVNPISPSDRPTREEERKLTDMLVDGDYVRGVDIPHLRDTSPAYPGARKIVQTVINQDGTATIIEEVSHEPDVTDASDKKIEADPSGRDPHQPGAKLDAGKNRPGLVLGGFPRALWAVAEIGTFGANKYTDNGWQSVPNGIKRYTDAMHRHILKEAMGEEVDPDSNLMHAAHMAWGALARLELMLREKEEQQKKN